MASHHGLFQTLSDYMPRGIAQIHLSFLLLTTFREAPRPQGKNCIQKLAADKFLMRARVPVQISRAVQQLHRIHDILLALLGPVQAGPSRRAALVHRRRRCHFISRLHLCLALDGHGDWIRRGRSMQHISSLSQAVS